MATQTEYFLGSDCSGSSGDSNRVLTISNTGNTTSNSFLVYASGLALSLNVDYTVNHKSSGTEITFLNPLWDDMTIVVQYDQSFIGVSGDFLNGPLHDFGVTVTRTPVTISTDFHGNKTYSEGTDESIEVVFENPNQNYGLDKSGLNKAYDARMFIQSDQSMDRNDKITYNSKIYEVKDVSPRYFDGNAMFKTVNLFYLKDE